jgi:azurin
MTTKNWKTDRLLSMCAALSLAVASQAGPAPGKQRVIEITGNDSMRYNLAEIDAKPGELLEVQLTNVGRLPKAAMAHDWVLLKPMSLTDIAAFAASASLKAPGYLPEDRSAVLAHTKMLGPKETDSIEFTAPSKPGTYPFICTFPGHYVLMKGELIVK